ncbi:DUF3106 domain-containing protein [Duganella sp. CF517]|uniref:DUF3106 domain-containing protein n=1 Tax=Duganella sp. CF517 TaxID=1881038 RepID=UPI001E4CA9FA|nr:DUF3106 domain-containing protein [Duganella sp. CF517]
MLASSPLTVSNGAIPPEKILWKDLPPAQQQALEPLAGEWDTMEPIRKQKWLGIGKRYASMKPDEQVRVQERMREWVKMTPEERRQVRQNFARAQKLDPSQKSTQWESYQQLTDEQKKALAARSPTKKQLANLPTPSQSKMKLPAPIKPGAPTTGTAVGTASPAATAHPPWIDPATGGPLPNASNIAPVIAAPAPSPAPAAAPAAAPAPTVTAPPAPAGDIVK